MTSDNRYSHGKIYKLIDNTTGVFYIGSTALKRIDQRYQSHKKACSCQEKKNMKIYKYFTPEIFASGDIRIIELEAVNVANKRELQKLENEYIIKELNNILCVNSIQSSITQEEKVIRSNIYQQAYREVTKEYRKEKQKIFREKKHERILA